MPDFKNLIARYRNSRSVYLALWCAIGLGIVPAIITENISPFDSFGHRFGVEIIEFIYLPRTVCLLVFLLGLAGCLIQNRYWMIALLLPWLALGLFEVDELAYKLPTKTEALERLHENRKLVRESAEPPNIIEIRGNLDQIVYADTALMPFDEEVLIEDLDRIEEALENNKPGLQKKSVLIAVQIVVLNRKIAQAEGQIKRIKSARQTTDLISRISFGLLDKRVKNNLRNGLKKVRKHRNALVSKRNAYHVDLAAINNAQAQVGATYADLRELEAKVKTYLWVSQSYQASYISQAYSLTCFAVLLILIWQFTLGSWVYLLTVAASLTISMLYVEATLSYRSWVVVKFVIISLIIRAFYLLYVENFPLLRRQSSAFMLQTLKKTLIYYLPFIALIGLGVLSSLHINKLIDDHLYSLKIMADADRNEPRRYNIDKAIDAYFKQQEEDAFKMLDGMAAQGASVDKIAKATVGFFEDNIVETLPEINQEFEPPGCDGFLPWVFNTANCAENTIKEPLNGGYTEERNEQRDSLRRSTSEYADKAKGNVKKAVQYAKEDLSENFLQIKLRLKTTLSHVYSAIDFYTWVSILLLIVFILKSFMYIFARIFFATDEDDKRVIQFEPVAQPQQHGLIGEVSDTLELTTDMGEQMYINKNYDFANAPPDEVTPQAHKAFFSRFKNGVWHLNKIKTANPEEVEGAPYRKIPDDERIVVWTLKPGDAVVFSWKTFVGMSDVIKIRTQYSWQLSSLVFGRMFFVVATVDADSPVDGTLLLVAKGSDGIRETTNPSNSPDQLLAWQTTTRFQLHASLSVRNVYRSGIQIKARDTDLAVMHLNDKKSKSGAAAFLKYFLVPV